MRSWDLTSERNSPAWREPWKLAMNNGVNIPYVAISNDTNTIADLSSYASRVADARTGKLRVTGPSLSNGSEVVRVLISPDAHTMATINNAGNVSLIDTATGKLRQTLTSSDTAVAVADNGPPGNPEAAFSPDGHYFAVWQNERGLELWDLHTGQSIAILDGRTAVHYPGVPATASNANTGPFIKWTNAQATRDMVVSFGAHDESITVTDAQTPDPAHTTHTVRAVTWSLRPADWVAAACTIVGRDLTTSEWNQYVGPDVPYHRTCTTLLPETHRP
jgi:WD40 repeat protein